MEFLGHGNSSPAQLGNGRRLPKVPLILFGGKMGRRPGKWNSDKKRRFKKHLYEKQDMRCAKCGSFRLIENLYFANLPEGFQLYCKEHLK